MVKNGIFLYTSLITKSTQQGLIFLQLLALSQQSCDPNIHFLGLRIPYTCGHASVNGKDVPTDCRWAVGLDSQS